MGRRIAGRRIAGRRIAGRRIAGRRIAGRRTVGATLFEGSLVGDTLALVGLVSTLALVGLVGTFVGRTIARGRIGGGRAGVQIAHGRVNYARRRKFDGGKFAVGRYANRTTGNQVTIDLNCRLSATSIYKHSRAPRSSGLIRCQRHPASEPVSFKVA